ncbi:hypothetical protein CEP53_005102 [Fusarium sp. AF-6]|nr:hypothetical protein CEP53_005102 [Fusarium sp. AF-6]
MLGEIRLALDLELSWGPYLPIRDLQWLAICDWAFRRACRYEGPSPMAHQHSGVKLQNEPCLDDVSVGAKVCGVYC